MTSNDNQQYITVEIFRSELGEFKTEMRSGFSETHKEIKELRAETQTVRDNTLVNSAKIDAYRDFTGIWFTVLTVVIGLVGLIAPLLRDIHKDAKQSRKLDDMRETAREVMREEIRETVQEFLKTSGILGK